MRTVLLALSLTIPCRAAVPVDPWSEPEAIAGAAADLAAEIPRRVGASHDAYAATRLTDKVVVHDWGAWCLNGGLKSLTVKGEASMLYMEILPEAAAGAIRLRGREQMYEQAKALAGGVSEPLARLERDLEQARRDQMRLAAREQALRAMLVGSKWAHLGSDGLLHLGFEYGKDFESVDACSGGGYDPPG